MEEGEEDTIIIITTGESGSMKKTKIVTTLGPASNDETIIENLIKEGVNVFRINASHGTHNEHRERIKIVRKLSKKLNKHISILLDLQGPKIRVGRFEKGEVLLKEGDEFILTSRDVVGKEKMVSVSYKGLPEDVKPGVILLLDDGALEFEVISTDKDEIRTKVLRGGILKDRKGINVRGAELKVLPITEKDREDIDFGIKEDVDFFALSFVRKREDILLLKEIIEGRGRSVPIIAKIEKYEAIKNLDEIIDASDGVMVARGDLGIEAPIEEVTLLQKKIIKKALRRGKFSITATQMLDSMIERPYPTRAEVSDITNAIFDGTDAVMLSGETASGKYPVESVRVMRRIAERVEKELPYEKRIMEMERVVSSLIPDSISYAGVFVAFNTKASLIVTATETGKTAIRISRFRPNVPILAITPCERVAKLLSIYWGVYPVVVERFKDTEDMVKKITEETRTSPFVKKGDLVVYLSGVIPGVPGGTNLLRVERL